MKSAANCDTSCELQIPWIIEFLNANCTPLKGGVCLLECRQQTLTKTYLFVVLEVESTLLLKLMERCSWSMICHLWASVNHIIEFNKFSERITWLIVQMFYRTVLVICLVQFRSLWNSIDSYQSGSLWDPTLEMLPLTSYQYFDLNLGKATRWT